MNSSITRQQAEARRKLAIDRSNQDARQSNDNLRVAAQASILINGGAATAVLAFLLTSIGKNNVNPDLFTAAGRAIMCYAAGVACAPFVIWFMNVALKHWNRSWQEVVDDPWNEALATKEHNRARPWYWISNVFLFGSIAGFVCGSWILSNGFLKAPW